MVEGVIITVLPLFPDLYGETLEENDGGDEDGANLLTLKYVGPAKLALFED